jgi:type VI secretion system protein ImpG
MRDELLGYYERELAYLRQRGAEFAKKYPKIAGRLQLEADKCEDPHVERMIEAFAFLAGRLRLKVDDEFPEITESFLNILYPHYLAPIPSMAIAQFALEPGSLTTGYHLPRGTKLYSRPIHGTPCRFHTTHPVTLWPIEVTSASLESLDPVDARGRWEEAVIKVSLQCLNNTTFSELRGGEDKLPPETLRFYINGEPQLTYPLYEMIFNQATRIELRTTKIGKPSEQTATSATTVTLVLRPDNIKQVGFENSDALLPYTARSFAGYRLLSEYFALPEKFLFFDVTGLDEAIRANFGDQFEILIYLQNVTPPRSSVTANTFQLMCTPIVNLFETIAEPIHLTREQHEYHVVADVRRQTATEVYSINSVSSADSSLRQVRNFQPFYSLRHTYGHETDSAFWYATRRQSQRPDDSGTEMYLSLVDQDFNPHVPATETITVHATCTNRDLPGELPFGGREADLDVEGAGPLARVHCLTKPTISRRPPARRGAQWRLISHLALNHVSLVSPEATGSPEALQEVLYLYDFLDSLATRKQIMGIENVTSTRVVRQTGSRIGAGLVRGLETTIEFDEEQYVGSGVFLFASVLERFLGLYASINSFNQLVAKTKQREGYLKRWSPRTGEQILL